MALQWSAYSLIDGVDIPAAGQDAFHFRYDKNKPGGPVEIVFPSGKKELTPDHLAELGVIFLALAGKDGTDRVQELLDGFELPPPKFMDATPQARELARQIMDNFISTFGEVEQQYRNNAAARIEVEEAIARGISRVCARPKKT